MATQKEKIKTNDLNDLFTRLETVRAKHAALGDVTSTQQTAMGGPYTGTAVVGDKITTNHVTQLKNTLVKLENSPHITTSGFSSKITIPTVASLLSASAINAISTTIAEVEALCANCAHFTSHFTTAASRSNFTSHFTTAASRSNFTTDFGHFTSAAQRSNFGDFTSAAQRSNFTSAASKGNFSHNASHNGSNFTSAASKGDFSHNASHNGTNFTSAASRSNFSHNGSHNGSNFTSAASKGNFTSAASKGDFIHYASNKTFWGGGVLTTNPLF